MFIWPQLLGKGNFDLIFLHGTPKTMKSLAKQQFNKELYEVHKDSKDDGLQ
jgi:hypothetical protein